MRKNRKKMIGFVLCNILLLGSTMFVQADTPVCGGNHSFSTVKEAGIDIIPGTRSIHNHNGHFCDTYTYYNRYLQRCACGAETVWVDTNSPHEAHHPIAIE